MAFIDDFLDVMNQEVVVSEGTTDAFGDFTAVSWATYPSCRVEGRQMMTKDSAGREVLSTVQIFFGDTTQDLTAKNHRYTLPLPWLPSGERVALSVEYEVDETGPAFCVVYLP